MAYAKKKESLETLQEKMSLLKNRLKKRAGDAQRLIDKAKSLNKFEEAKSLQDMNLKVTGLLDQGGSTTFMTQIWD